MLFGVGGLAVLAGLGSLAYRRRLTRKLRTGQDTPQTPADREPADH
jgi:nitrate reductase gamma subunit